VEMSDGVKSGVGVRSRVGSKPVFLPKGVSIGRQEGIDVCLWKVSGPSGDLFVNCPDVIGVSQEDACVVVRLLEDSLLARKLWGTVRQNIHNAVKGVSEGFSKELEIQGVGYRVLQVSSEALHLKLGFSHDVIYKIPKGITITSESPTAFLVKGFCKQMVGQVASEIRSFRPPEPYKGKGIRYKNEEVRKKEGKKK
jgi:large subunit ribosomal protein L6